MSRFCPNFNFFLITDSVFNSLIKYRAHKWQDLLKMREISVFINSGSYLVFLGIKFRVLSNDEILFLIYLVSLGIKCWKWILFLIYFVSLGIKCWKWILFLIYFISLGIKCWKWILFLIYFVSLGIKCWKWILFLIYFVSLGIKCWKW